MLRMFLFTLFVSASLAISAQELNVMIWNAEKTASASCYGAGLPTCQVIVNGAVIDVSQMTYSNIGKLGIAELDEYERVVTEPTKWLESDGTLQMVNFRARAWRGGQRYSVSEPVVVKDGKYFAR